MPFRQLRRERSTCPVCDPDGRGIRLTGPTWVLRMVDLPELPHRVATCDRCGRLWDLEQGAWTEISWPAGSSPSSDVQPALQLERGSREEPGGGAPGPSDPGAGVLELQGGGEDSPLR